MTIQCRPACKVCGKALRQRSELVRVEQHGMTWLVRQKIQAYGYQGGNEFCTKRCMDVYAAQQSQLKPLDTLAEIHAAYPEHAKLDKVDREIKGALRLSAYLLKEKIYFFRKNPFSIDEWESECIRETGGYDPEVDPYYEYLRDWGIEDAWLGVKMDVILQAFGIDPQKLSEEKTDMLNQMRMQNERRGKEEKP